MSAMTVKDLIAKYRKRFGDSSMVARSKEHFDFWQDLFRLSGEKCKKMNPYPPDIDAAAELNDEEELIWRRRLDNLPDYAQENSAAATLYRRK